MSHNEYYGGIGDPTIIGWTITIAYFIAAYLCWWTAKVERENDSDIHHSRSYLIWFALSIMLIFLGINKQYDLQTFFISAGRSIALNHGWYGMRREVQLMFIGFIGLFGLLSIVLIISRFRDRFCGFWLIIFGLVLLVSFVVIRAASFNHVDYLLSKWRVIGPFRMKYVVELGGIILIASGAIQKLRRNIIGRLGS